MQMCTHTPHRGNTNAGTDGPFKKYPFFFLFSIQENRKSNLEKTKKVELKYKALS